VRFWLSSMDGTKTHAPVVQLADDPCPRALAHERSSGSDGRRRLPVRDHHWGETTGL
jgi:hypothetical protein